MASHERQVHVSGTHTLVVSILSHIDLFVLLVK